MTAQQLTEDGTSASYLPRKIDPCRDSLNTVATDVDDMDASWNIDMDMSSVPDRTRAPVGRSASFDPRRISGLKSATTPGPMGNPRRCLPKRSVSFGKVQVRKFERVLTNNPPSCCPGGPSLGLGWNYTEKEAVDVDKFEGKGKFPFGIGRRNKDILMTAEKREKVAKKLGFSPEEIQANAKQMQKVNRQRERTVNAFMEQEYEAMFIMERARQATSVNVWD